MSPVGSCKKAPCKFRVFFYQHRPSDSVPTARPRAAPALLPRELTRICRMQEKLASEYKVLKAPPDRTRDPGQQFPSIDMGPGASGRQGTQQLPEQALHLGYHVA